MRRYRVLLLAVAAIVLVCVCARACGEDDTDPDPAPPAAGPPPAPQPAPPPAAPATAGPLPGAGPSAAPPVASASPAPDGRARQDSTGDHPEGEVSGAQTLDAADAPAAIQAAEVFAQTWVSADPRWPEPLLELATPALAEALARSATGPPEREVTGGGFLLFDAPRWARIGVPVSGGAIVLDLSLMEGRWLVSAVAWWPESAEVAP